MQSKNTIMMTLPRENEMDEEATPRFHIKKIRNWREDIENHQIRKSLYFFLDFLHATTPQKDTISKLISHLYKTIHILQKRYLK